MPLVYTVTDEHSQLELTQPAPMPHTFDLHCIILCSIELATRKQNKTEHRHPALWPLEKNPNPRDMGIGTLRHNRLVGKRTLHSFPSLGGERKKPPPQTRSLHPEVSPQSPGFPQTQLPLTPPPPHPPLIFLAHSPPTVEVLARAVPRGTQQMKQGPFSKSNTTRVVKPHPAT